MHRDHKPAEALAWAEQAVRIGERYAENSRARAYTVGMHAFVLRTNKRPAEAEAEAVTALRMASPPGNEPHWRLWWVGEMHELLGRIHRESGRFDDARREYAPGAGAARAPVRRGVAAHDRGPRRCSASTSRRPAISTPPSATIGGRPSCR